MSTCYQPNRAVVLDQVSCVWSDISQGIGQSAFIATLYFLELFIFLYLYFFLSKYKKGDSTRKPMGMVWSELNEELTQSWLSSSLKEAKVWKIFGEKIWKHLCFAKIKVNIFFLWDFIFSLSFLWFLTKIFIQRNFRILLIRTKISLLWNNNKNLKWTKKHGNIWKKREVLMILSIFK